MFLLELLRVFFSLLLQSFHRSSTPTLTHYPYMYRATKTPYVVVFKTKPRLPHLLVEVLYSKQSKNKTKNARYSTFKYSVLIVVLYTLRLHYHRHASSSSSTFSELPYTTYRNNQETTKVPKVENDDETNRRRSRSNSRQ